MGIAPGLGHQNIKKAAPKGRLLAERFPYMRVGLTLISIRLV